MGSALQSIYFALNICNLRMAAETNGGVVLRL